jgi:cytochrome c oxidase subunit 1
MNESLGRWHFVLTFVFAYATFLPMHFLGMAGHPRRFSEIPAAVGFLQRLWPVQRFITVAAICLMLAQLIFFLNLFWSLKRGKKRDNNPWQATTLEWATLPETQAVSVLHGPYEYGVAAGNAAASDYVMQHEPVPSQVSPE